MIGNVFANTFGSYVGAIVSVVARLICSKFDGLRWTPDTVAAIVFSLAGRIAFLRARTPA